MPSYPLKALVLRKTKLGETDIILTLLAEDGRQVRAVAKGLRKPGSRFGARLEPYAVCDLLLHTGKSLEVVTEASTSISHSALREDYDRSAAASVVADLLDKISLEGQPEERLFALSVATLDAMETAQVAALPALVTGFLIKAMAMHGYRPELDACAHCGEPLAGAERFSMQAGGALCPACDSADSASVPFSAQGRAWLLMLLRSTMAQIAQAEMPAAAVSDCFELMWAFVVYHVPARLKALDFYATQMPTGQGRA
ncbi:MAG: DNA repair protein RecO [Actinobacteria bacterium]|nr:MAG: DNA repair protein RecO [Actinomycetota bacterium]